MFAGIDPGISAVKAMLSGEPGQLQAISSERPEVSLPCLLWLVVPGTGSKIMVAGI